MLYVHALWETHVIFCMNLVTCRNHARGRLGDVDVDTVLFSWSAPVSPEQTTGCSLARQLEDVDRAGLLVLPPPATYHFPVHAVPLASCCSSADCSIGQSVFTARGHRSRRIVTLFT